LRSCLQYALYRGKTKLDFVAAVRLIANWSLASIPRAIAADQVRQLLASIDSAYLSGVPRPRDPASARSTGFALR